MVDAAAADHKGVGGRGSCHRSRGSSLPCSWQMATRWQWKRPRQRRQQGRRQGGDKGGYEGGGKGDGDGDGKGGGDGDYCRADLRDVLYRKHWIEDLDRVEEQTRWLKGIAAAVADGSSRVSPRHEIDLESSITVEQTSLKKLDAQHLWSGPRTMKFVAVWMRNGTVAPAISISNTLSAQDDVLLGSASLRWPRSVTRQTWRVPNLMQTSTSTSKQLQMRRRLSGRRWKRLRQKVGGRHASGDSTALGCKEILRQNVFQEGGSPEGLQKPSLFGGQASAPTDGRTSTGSRVIACGS